MPFTPFHMGPGLAIKALSARYFSLASFGFAQLIIDVEPLVHLLRHDKVLHGFTHTYLGALLVGLAVLVIGKPVIQAMLRFLVPTLCVGMPICVQFRAVFRSYQM